MNHEKRSKQILCYALNLHSKLGKTPKKAQESIPGPWWWRSCKTKSLKTTAPVRCSPTKQTRKTTAARFLARGANSPSQQRIPSKSAWYGIPAFSHRFLVDIDFLVDITTKKKQQFKHKMSQVFPPALPPPVHNLPKEKVSGFSPPFLIKFASMRELTGNKCGLILIILLQEGGTKSERNIYARRPKRHTQRKEEERKKGKKDGAPSPSCNHR